MTLVEQLQSVDRAHAFIIVVSAYCIGCFTTGYYLVKMRTGRDIRQVGSGNPGARNVGRLLGRTGFFFTLLGDFGKGVLAVGIARWFTQNDLLAAFALLAVTIGHVWPLQLQFAGGKGVATSLGALLIYEWRIAIAYAVFFLAGFILQRRTILPGLVAYALLPFAAWWLHRDGLEVALLLALSGLVLFAHRQNLVDEIPALAHRRGTTKSKP